MNGGTHIWIGTNLGRIESQAERSKPHIVCVMQTKIRILHMVIHLRSIFLMFLVLLFFHINTIITSPVLLPRIVTALREVFHDSSTAI